MNGPKRIALTAHDRKKELLCDWVEQHQTVLQDHTILCTATTGGKIYDWVPSLNQT